MLREQLDASFATCRLVPESTLAGLSMIHFTKRSWEVLQQETGRVLTVFACSSMLWGADGTVRGCVGENASGPGLHQQV